MNRNSSLSIMEEKHLFFFALIVAFIGLTGLFFCTSFLNYPLTAIQDITLEDKGKNIRIQGEIISFSQRENTITFTLQDDTGKIFASAYGTITLPLEKKQWVEVEGTIGEYNCALQISVQQVKLISF